VISYPDCLTHHDSLILHALVVTWENTKHNLYFNCTITNRSVNVNTSCTVRTFSRLRVAAFRSNYSRCGYGSLSYG
jgi:hypothetical protein